MTPQTHLSAELRAVRIAEVSSSSKEMLESRIPRSDWASQEFQVQRATPITNTFLNFMEAEPGVFHRSASFDFGHLRVTSHDGSEPLPKPPQQCDGPEDELQESLKSPLHLCVPEKGCMRTEEDASVVTDTTYLDSALPSACNSNYSAWSSSSHDHDPFTLEILARLQQRFPQEEEGEEQEPQSTPALQQQQQQQHEVQPQSLEASSADAASKRQEKVTTMMIQNLPRVFMKQDLLDMLDACGFQGRYDFVHVAYSFSSGICQGYAFINFKDAAVAETFQASWSGETIFCQRKHKKALVVTTAFVQGLETLLAQPSMRKLQKVKNPAFRPFVDASK